MHGVGKGNRNSALQRMVHPLLICIPWGVKWSSAGTEPISASCGCDSCGIHLLRTCSVSLLRLVITNRGSQSVSLVTGVITGSTPHPAAAFRFDLEIPNHHKVQLVCTSADCGLEGVAGSLAPYIIHLAPAETFSLQLPLDAFYRGGPHDERLCDEQTANARLLITLAGGQRLVLTDMRGTDHFVPALTTNSSKLPDGNRRATGPLWSGSLSTNVMVRCP